MDAQYGRAPKPVEGAGSGSQHDRAAQMRSALDIAGNLPAGVIVVNESARCLWRNTLADKILAKNTVLRINGGTLAAQDYTTELHALIKAAARNPKSPCVLSIARPQYAFPLYLLVLSILWPDPEATGEGKALAIVISDPALPRTPDRQVLQRLYGFTQSEAVLAAHMMKGQPLASVAEEMHISPNTARSHLKKLFQKTGTARQSELVWLLLNGPAMMCGDADEPCEIRGADRGTGRQPSTETPEDEY